MTHFSEPNSISKNFDPRRLFEYFYFIISDVLRVWKYRGERRHAKSRASLMNQRRRSSTTGDFVDKSRGSSLNENVYSRTLPANVFASLHQSRSFHLHFALRRKFDLLIKDLFSFRMPLLISEAAVPACLYVCCVPFTHCFQMGNC